MNKGPSLGSNAILTTLAPPSSTGKTPALEFRSVLTKPGHTELIQISGYFFARILADKEEGQPLLSSEPSLKAFRSSVSTSPTPSSVRLSASVKTPLAQSLGMFFNFPKEEETLTILGESDNWRSGISASALLIKIIQKTYHGTRVYYSFKSITVYLASTNPCIVHLFSASVKTPLAQSLGMLFNFPAPDETLTILGESDNWRSGISASAVLLAP
ncbi:hypothetical protein Prudu_006667 [Prunus dulcis]|uniref:Uncharacterized protein n=1 Tax=Prunus dulcis TaxID=3755 RepID=A0A4Y1R0A2_PRUDU|nr:hypothetical protein Prudu_006667 [Prunus dulcis]